MSLFFKQRMEEQKENPLKDTIKFTFPWILRSPPPPENGQRMFMDKHFRTSYLLSNEIWHIQLTENGVRVAANGAMDDDDDDAPPNIWNGTCYLTYKLYYDNAMRFLYYSSAPIPMISYPHTDAFQSPDGCMTKMKDAIKAQSIRTIVIFVEMQLPAKYFSRPYYKPSCDLIKKLCHQYPSDMEINFRFSFLQRSDFAIQCPDGLIQCRRIVLNIASEYFKTYFKTSKENPVLIVEHAFDVTKLIVTYLHSRCFEMPKAYDLDFAKRLLFALDFFNPEHESAIKNSIHLSLCQKFADECKDFNALLQWTSLATRQSLNHLEKMVATVIAKKYYYKWLQTFPLTARNFENLLFLDIFGSESTEIFDRIDNIFTESFLTNVILE